MDLKVLRKITKIVEIKKDRISIEHELKRMELVSFGEAITKLLNGRKSLQEGTNIDSSSRWYEGYMLKLLQRIETDIHNYAAKRYELALIKLQLSRESQREKALNKIIEKEVVVREKEDQNKEEEDVEELCIAKQYSGFGQI